MAPLVQGKIALSSIRVAISTGLGENTEGDWQDVVGNLPVDLTTPSIIIVDEYAEVAVEGFAVTATQGRGLGTGVVFSGQDLAGFLRASEEETKQIFGNTRLKVLMSIEDVEDSWEWFRKLASTMYTHEARGVEKDDTGAMFSDTTGTTLKQVDRLNFLDVKEQIEGEAHIFQGSKMVKGKLFNLLWDSDRLKKDVANFRFNRMLQVAHPTQEQVDKVKKRWAKKASLQAMLAQPLPIQKPSPLFDSIEDKSGIRWVKRAIKQHAEGVAGYKPNDSNLP